MDPLSVIASVIAVAGALYSVSRKLKSCAKTMVHAGKEIIAIAREMSSFSNILRSLQDTLRLVESLVSQEQDVLQICDDLVSQAYENVEEFEEFLKDLEPLRFSGNAKVFAKTLARLKWAFQKSDLVLLRSKLDSSKSTLSMCMNLIQMKVATAALAAALENKQDEKKVKQLRSQV